MARKIYLFKTAAVDYGIMPEQVPGDPVKKSMTPCVLCYAWEIEEEYFGDLEQFLESQKWTFVKEMTDPVGPMLPLVMAGDSGAMYDITIDDSDPQNPVLRITPQA